MFEKCDWSWMWRGGNLRRVNGDLGLLLILIYVFLNRRKKGELGLDPCCKGSEGSESPLTEGNMREV